MRQTLRRVGQLFTGLYTAATARTELGLGNVDNTSDAAKPVSAATTVALAAKAPLAHTHVVGQLGTGTPAAGKYLDGSGAWTVLPAGGGGGSTVPGGTSGQIQRNNAGAFAGDPYLISDGAGVVQLGSSDGAITSSLILHAGSAGGSYPLDVRRLGVLMAGIRNDGFLVGKNIGTPDDTTACLTQDTAATGVAGLLFGKNAELQFATGSAWYSGLGIGLGITAGQILNAYAAGLRFTRLSANGTRRPAGRIDASLVDTSDNNFRGRLVLVANDSGGDREALAIESSGTAPRLGFFGSAPVVRPSLTYSRSGETTAAAQQRQALATLGLWIDSTTP